MSFAIFDCDIGFEGADALWIRDCMKGFETEIYRVRNSQLPLDPFANEGIIISGSSASANDDLPWIDDLCQIMRASYERSHPVLGICFGHQILATAFGGIVTKRPVMNVGWQPVDYNPDAELFRGLNNPFEAFFLHSDQVECYPGGITHMAYSSGLSGFNVNGKPLYAVQFHPEINSEITDLVLDTRKQKIEQATGRAIAEFSSRDPAASYEPGRIIQNFCNIARRYQNAR